MSEHRIKLGISLGDLNGIGPEVAVKTFSDKRMLDFCTPIFFGSHKLSAFLANEYGHAEMRFQNIRKLDELRHNVPNMMHCWDEDLKIEPGQMNETGGRAAFLSLTKATEALKNGEIDALVTAPIHKHGIKSEDFPFNGHTEFLEDYFGDKSLMILMHENLRVALVTGHIPLKEVSEKLTQEAIFSKLNLFRDSLKKDFSVRNPIIAVLGLNPHNGDEGEMGTEESEIIKPALAKAREKGMQVFGPFPADGFFGAGKHEQFDGVLAMYHDQGLTPFKTLAFENGVNFTAGLPVVRTSPDHGTAIDIAGKNVADESSFRQAVYAAIDICRNRKMTDQLSSNILPNHSPPKGRRK